MVEGLADVRSIDGSGGEFGVVADESSEMVHQFRGPWAQLWVGDSGIKLLKRVKADGDNPQRVIAVEILPHPIRVVGYVESSAEQITGLVIDFTNNTRQPPTEERDFVPLDIVWEAHRFEKWLRSRGMATDKGVAVLGRMSAAAVLAAWLWSADPGVRIIERSVSGWTPGRDCYLLEDEPIGPDSDGEPRYRARLANEAGKLAKRGTVSSWQRHIAPQAAEHPAWTCGVLIALAAPLMHLLDLDHCGGGFHFYGHSSTGKSITAEVAAGIYGVEPKQWRQTANALEGAAALRNHSILVLDEIGQADPKTVNDSMYMLANEQGKGRMNQDSSVKETLAFSLLTISTGEVSLPDVLRRVHVVMHEGQHLRFLSIPMMQHKIPGSVAREFKKTIRKHQGEIGRSWLRLLCTPTGFEPEENNILEAEQRKVYEEALAAGLEYAGKDCPKTGRVWERLAVLVAAGKMAVDYQLLPASWAAEIPDTKRGGVTTLIDQAVRGMFDAWAEDLGLDGGTFAALDDTRHAAQDLVEAVGNGVAHMQVLKFTGNRFEGQEPIRPDSVWGWLQLARRPRRLFNRSWTWTNQTPKAPNGQTPVLGMSGF